jgi:hypothetical protein
MAQYVVGLDSSLKRLFVWKTTGDPTTLTNWSAQDTGVTLMSKCYSLWSVLDGTDIHVATYSRDWSDTTTINKVEHHVFDTTTDSWTVIRDKAGMNSAASDADSGFFGCSLGVRSDGDVVVLFTDEPADTDVDVVYSRKESGTWTRDQNVSTGSGDHRIAGVVQMGASDRAHFFFLDTTLTQVKHRSLSSANSLDTESLVFGSKTGVNYSSGRGISYADNGNTVVKFPFVRNFEDLWVAYFNSGANPTISTITAGDNEPVDVNSSLVACLAVDGTNSWILYSGGGEDGVDQDIYSDEQAGSMLVQDKSSVTSGSTGQPQVMTRRTSLLLDRRRSLELASHRQSHLEPRS